MGTTLAIFSGGTVTSPTKAFIEQVQNDKTGLLTVLSAVSLFLPVVIFVDVLLDLSEQLTKERSWILNEVQF